MKICKICKLEKDLSEFNKRKLSKDGIDYSCRECLSDLNKKYNENNRLKIKNRRAKHYQENKERLNFISKEFHRENKDIIKDYYLRSDVKLRYREYRKKYKNDRKKNDNIFCFSEKIRKTISNLFKKNGFNKSKKTNEILGCTFIEFKIYLESKFENWMTWDNKGLYNGDLNYGWDIDHIIPISTAKTVEDLIKLNHYSNLQPLCSKINRDIKRDNENYEMSI